MFWMVKTKRKRCASWFVFSHGVTCISACHKTFSSFMKAQFNILLTITAYWSSFVLRFVITTSGVCLKYCALLFVNFVGLLVIKVDNIIAFSRSHNRGRRPQARGPRKTIEKDKCAIFSENCATLNVINSRGYTQICVGLGDSPQVRLEARLEGSTHTIKKSFN